MLACLLATESPLDIIDPAIDRYLHELANPEDPILREMELLAAERGFPIVGPQVGSLLSILTRASGARRVLELGSGFGYSAYWFAQAVGPEGRVVLTEASEELAAEAEHFLTRGGLAPRVRIVVGNALSVAAELESEFDIVFNDVDKQDYPQVLDIALDTLRPGGLLVSDNMLWFGTVLEESSEQPSTRGVQELTRRLRRSDSFDTTWLPIRDGVSISLRLR